MSQELLSEIVVERIKEEYELVNALTELGHTISKCVILKRGETEQSYTLAPSNKIRFNYRTTFLDSTISQRMLSVANVEEVEPGADFQFDIDRIEQAFTSVSSPVYQSLLTQWNLPNKLKKVTDSYWLVNDREKYPLSASNQEILEFVRNNNSNVPSTQLQKLPGGPPGFYHDIPGINVTYLGGSGYGILEGSILKLSLSERSIDLLDPKSLSQLSVLFAHIQGLEFDGGVFQKGGGFMGGGFGLGGFVIGAASSAVLNKITTRTNIQTVMRILTSEGEMNFFTDEATPDQLDMALADVRTGIRNREVNPAPVNSGISQVEQLEKLVKLRDQGVLTNEEFDAQKSKILNS